MDYNRQIYLPIKSEESLFMAKNKLTSTKSDMIASGRRLSNRHGDNNDDRHRKFDHSECYEKPQRPEQSEKPRGNNEKHDIAFTEERCYTCQRGHKYYECLESQVSGGSDTKRSTSPKPRNDKREKNKRVGKVRFEKKSNKELQPSLPKKEPKSYAFFSQEIAVTVKNPQKRAREE